MNLIVINLKFFNFKYEKFGNSKTKFLKIERFKKKD